MAISSANAAAAPKVRKVETLLSGTSWTVPAGVEFVNATLIGAGGGGGSCFTDGAGSINAGGDGRGGQIVETTVTTTPGASITYAIGAGGASNTAGGNTTFTGATTATGGLNGRASGTGTAGSNGMTASNGGGGGANGPGTAAGGAGGSGSIILEYWV